MAYFLRREKKKKGTYLQMYESYWDKAKKQPRTRSIEAFGYAEDLISDEIPDPVAYYKEYVKQKNEERAKCLADKTRPRAFVNPAEKHIGHFLLSSLLEELDVKKAIDSSASQRRFRFSIYEMFAQLIYARALCPCSESKTACSVFPNLYRGAAFSEDQVCDGCSFIGASYEKYIELFNRCYEKRCKRDFSQVYFDCANYYFEIDLASEDKQKGPSEESRRNPIVGLALLLDADLIPLDMRIYPGNESEKPYIGKVTDEMKRRRKISGKTIQVADKGLDCARNIYAAVKEANDGYIFSKSIHGRNLSEKEKLWITLENDSDAFVDRTDETGRLMFRLKSCIDTFSYRFCETDPKTKKDAATSFSVIEKRIVSYDPALAKKQKAEIMRMADSASRYIACKNIARQDLGDCAKYVKAIDRDKMGKKTNPVIELDQAQIDEDLKFAGYSLLVTSELDMDPLQVYRIYRDLRKIEESFRIAMSCLDASPVCLQKKETICGHFLICCLSLFLLRVLEIKVFKNRVTSYDLINFMRDFRVAEKGDGSYINISKNQAANEKIKKVSGLSNLDALFLSEKEVEDFFRYSMPIDS